MGIYNGFSTVGRSKKFKLSDFDLAKQDLYNSLNIRKGEKLMNPDFGTIIWDLIFQPLTSEVITSIQDDLTRIINYDPRLQINDISITEFQFGIQVQINLTFMPTDETETMLYTFNNTP